MGLLRDPEGPSTGADRLRDLFDLTPAEAELARCLLAGRTLREIAGASGRSVNTVRNHLAHLMGKTHTNRQSELVPLLAEAAALRDPGREGAG